MRFIDFVPAELLQIGLTLALSFLIGLQREEHKASDRKPYAFGGIRTFPLIGMLGYMMSRFSGGDPLAVGLGFAALAALLWLSYRKKLSMPESAGLTTEISGLLTFLLGAFIQRGFYWEASALAVIALMLLALKEGLEKAARRIPPDEIYTFTRFLLISAVILPIVPNEPYTTFAINPFKIWLMVVAITGLSYAAYGISRWLGHRHGVLLSAVLGGLYSSTFTTLMLARHGGHRHPRLLSGAMLMSCGIMYLRATLLLFFFSPELASTIGPVFLVLFVLSVVGGWLWSRGDKGGRGTEQLNQRNPLQLSVGLAFAALFVVITVLIRFVKDSVGSAGLYVVSFISGLIDVDPFLLSMAQSVNGGVGLEVAGPAALVATASNNLLKATYAFMFAEGRLRVFGGGALALLSLAGFASIAFVL